MKIKCINIYNEHTKKFESMSSSLTIGKEYIVLEIIFSTKKGVLYRLVGDSENKMPALYLGSQFDIVTEIIPSTWSICIVNKSLIILGPKVWRENEFWDSCYDHDPGALEIYKRETKIIYEEEEFY